MKKWLVIALLSCTTAMAHDYEKPELQGWFMGLKSRSKTPCCDGSDANHLADVDWSNEHGHYHVRIEGNWIDVPDSAVVEGPNKDGSALVWLYYINGAPIVRCFMAGAEI